MLTPIQTRLLQEAPAPSARRSRTHRSRWGRDGAARTLPLPLAPSSTDAAPSPLPARTAPESAAPEIDPAALLRDIVREAAGIYRLEVRGDAMRDALVDDGDVVMLQGGVPVADGDLAAVRVAGDPAVSLRRVYFENGHVRLQSENHRLPPTVVARDAVSIEGRVIAVVRREAA